jgi:hypothetical protein
MNPTPPTTPNPAQPGQGRPTPARPATTEKTNHVTTSPTVPDVGLIWLDPRYLEVAGNIRHSPGELTELTASIKALGVLEPLIVIPTDTGHRVIAGARRAAASTAAGLTAVPCWSRPDLAGCTTELATQLVENEHRLPLSASERIHAYQQLNLAGFHRPRSPKPPAPNQPPLSKPSLSAAPTSPPPPPDATTSPSTKPSSSPSSTTTTTQ